MKKILFFFFILTFHFSLFSQEIYQPIDTTSNRLKSQFLSRFESRHEKNIVDIKARFSRKHRRLMEKIYESQFESFTRDVRKGELYFDKSNKQYVEKLLNHVIESNPSLKRKKFYVYLSRSQGPNAYSVGDGTIVFHLDLFNLLENEAEFVSVLTHEMAHYILNHRDKSVEKYAKYINSEAYKEKVSDIRNNRYGKQTKAEKLLKNMIYSRKNKSRGKEYEADSLGMILYSNTKYNTQHMINAISNFADVDKEKDSLNIDFIKKIFHTKNQPFNKDWLFTEDYSYYNYSEEKRWNIDSLKTHPNVENRVLRLEEIQKQINKKDTSTFVIDEEKFNEIKRIAKYEKVYNYYVSEDYGLGMYNALKAIKNNPDDKFNLKMFSLFLTKLADAKKDMKFNSYVPNINPTEQTNSQQMFINFIANISATEFNKLSKDYRDITQ